MAGTSAPSAVRKARACVIPHGAGATSPSAKIRAGNCFFTQWAGATCGILPLKVLIVLQHTHAHRPPSPARRIQEPLFKNDIPDVIKLACGGFAEVFFGGGFTSPAGYVDVSGIWKPDNHSRGWECRVFRQQLRRSERVFKLPTALKKTHELGLLGTIRCVITCICGHSMLSGCMGVWAGLETGVGVACACPW